MKAKKNMYNLFYTFFKLKPHFTDYFEICPEMRALANMGDIIQVANCNKRDEYKQKREMVRT